ncbi:ATP-dependent Clp protease subunit, heat shock protein 100, partial [Trypanosoma cruzi]
MSDGQPEWTNAAATALQDAVALARKHSNGFLDPVHLACALFKDENGLPSRVLKKVGAGIVMDALMARVEAIPTQSPAPTQPHPNSDMTRVLNTAEQKRVAFGDTLLAVDHLLLALYESKDTNSILKAAGADSKIVEKALKELRKGKKITSEFQDQNYDALSKYA